MRILIALKSCCRDLDQGFHQAIRETWGKDFIEADVRFFVGQGDHQTGFRGYLKDEIRLICGDGYDDLPAKTKEICRWALTQNYDFTFFCDNDTFVIPAQLLYTIFRNYDYSGRFGADPPLGTIFSYRDCHEIDHPECNPWASGGVGYFLSKKAMQAVADAEITSWAEDLWVGQVIGPHIISGEMRGLDLPQFECESAWHVARLSVFEHKFYPEMIREIYRHGRPELWYAEVAADEYKALQILASRPKPRVLSNKELQDRQKSAELYRASKKRKGN